MEERSTFSRAVVKAAHRAVASKDRVEQFCCWGSPGDPGDFTSLDIREKVTLSLKTCGNILNHKFVLYLRVSQIIVEV